MISFTIPLVPRTKKNSSQMLMNRKTKKLYPAPSRAFLRYQEDAGWHIPHKNAMINKRLNVKCVFYMDVDYANSKAVIDLVGLLQAVDDTLVHYRVIADDNCRIIVSHDGSHVLHDRERPRTEIEITEVET